MSPTVLELDKRRTDKAGVGDEWETFFLRLLELEPRRSKTNNSIDYSIVHDRPWGQGASSRDATGDEEFGAVPPVRTTLCVSACHAKHVLLFAHD